jgi:hypothetical protein
MSAIGDLVDDVRPQLGTCAMAQGFFEFLPLEQPAKITLG